MSAGQITVRCIMDKPTVFNYRDYTDLKEEHAKLQRELAKLKAENANLQIRCRIAEEELEWQSARVAERI